jgi:ribonuclease P protein component
MEVVERHFFPKSERLCLKNDINRLFNSGLSFIAYPLRILYLSELAVSQSGVEVLTSVSKKRFKRAVHRNRIKRFISEAYRLKGNELKSAASQNDKRLYIAFMYISNVLPAYKDVETGMKKAMKMLENKIILNNS